MTKISYKDIVGIISIVFYLPALFIALFLSFRHGFGRTSGWILLVAFAAVRIAGNAITIDIDHISHPSTGLITAAAILASVGLSPLLMAMTGFLGRIDVAARRNNPTSSTAHHVIISINIPLLLGLILSLVGGIQASNDIKSAGGFYPNNIFKAGAVLFFLSFLLVAAIAVLLLSRRQPGWIGRDEQFLLFAILASLPFLLVRVIYILCVAFDSSNKDFNLLGGSETVQLCMSTIEEFIVVAMWLLAGLFLRKMPKQVDAEKHQNWNAENPGQHYEMQLDGQYQHQQQTQHRQQYPQGQSKPGYQSQQARPSQDRNFLRYVPIVRRFVR